MVYLTVVANAEFMNKALMNNIDIQWPCAFHERLWANLINLETLEIAMS